MDVTAIAFYAVICGTLGVVAPNLGSVPIRLGIGAAVGIVAATILPVIKGMIGY